MSHYSSNFPRFPYQGNVRFSFVGVKIMRIYKIFCFKFESCCHTEKGTNKRKVGDATYLSIFNSYFYATYLSIFNSDFNAIDFDYEYGLIKYGD